MRIAQIAPLSESVPPKSYGGTERVVSFITEELVRQGHDVTLFASGDSISAATLRAGCRTSLRSDACCEDPLAHHLLMLEQVCKDAHDFDVIHNHVDYLGFPLARRCSVPLVTTVHGRLNMPDRVSLYQEFSDLPLISISNAQREPLPWANWFATVYHGLPVDMYAFREKRGDYLAFLGRICPEKGVDVAIDIAQRVGMPLKIAAKIDKTDMDYFNGTIRPLLDRSEIEFIGEINDSEKNDFLGNAYALLFTIDWPEPFGLVMIEAMACGTPVVANCRGSVPEVMKHGETGFIVKTVQEAVAAVHEVAMVDRRGCREEFESRFTADRMVQEYVEYFELLRDGTSAAPRLLVSG